MRRLFPLSALALAACATTPPAPVKPVAPVIVEQPESGDLIGLAANELGARFGQPRLQVREGAGTKLQFTTSSCVLDAYLYPPPSGQGLARVTHIDTRNREGRNVDQAICIRALQGP